MFFLDLLQFLFEYLFSIIWGIYPGVELLIICGFMFNILMIHQTVFHSGFVVLHFN